ncbi:MAG: 5-formyltetrahydrofolate cyclo-ligase [Tenacibaculum sp.]
MKKNALRTLYKQKRNKLNTAQKTIFEKSIYCQIYSMSFKEFNNIHLFLSIQKHNEINTQPLIDFFRKQNKKIITSKCNFNNNSLSHYYLKKGTELKTNKFGVPEPVNAVEISVKEIDLVFVPLLISDTKNYRVGYGKGFYDRFLASCRKNVKTIGLNYFSPVKTISNLDKFDIPLNTVIYPKL